MKYVWLLLLFCLATWRASAQGTGTSGPVLDEDLVAKGFVMTGFVLLCNFIVIIIRLLLNYLLKKQMVAAATSESVIERLLPGPQNEQNKVAKWVALLLSTGTGLALCSRYLPWELHPVIILLFSTAGGLLAYYFFLRYHSQAK